MTRTETTAAPASALTLTLPSDPTPSAGQAVVLHTTVGTGPATVPIATELPRPVEPVTSSMPDLPTSHSVPVSSGEPV
jgi:hypothetical protein